jgi:hypothetical protein
MTLIGHWDDVLRLRDGLDPLMGAVDPERTLSQAAACRW